MKAWLKKFFKGTYLAFWTIIVIGVVFAVLRVGAMVIIVAAAWLGSITSTTHGIIITLCVCFVVIFGLLWSILD